MSIEYSTIIFNKSICGSAINFSVMNSDCCIDVNINAAKAENIELSIFNNNGQRIIYQKKYLAAGQNTINLYKINMPAGFYIAKLENRESKILKEIKFIVK